MIFHGLWLREVHRNADLLEERSEERVEGGVQEEYLRYMDDGRIFIPSLRIGWRWWLKKSLPQRGLLTSMAFNKITFFMGR